MQEMEPNILICTWYIFRTNLWIVQACRFTQGWSYEKGFPFIFEGKSIGMIWDHGTTNDWNWNFIRSSILCILFIVIVIIYNFVLVKEKASLKLGGGLSQCYIHAPIMSSQKKWLLNNFMLSFLTTIVPCSILLVLVLYDEDYWIQMGFIGKN